MTRLAASDERTALDGRPHVPDEIQTFTGRNVVLSQPRATEVDRRDVAHGLAHTCRFGGQCDRFYSVAEHAVLCYVIAQRDREATPSLNLAALHHDDAEAYIGDVPSPMKPLLGDPWRRLETVWDAVTMNAAGLPSHFHDAAVVKRADYDAVTVEAAWLMFAPGWDWARRRARDELLCGIHDIAFWTPGLAPAIAEQLYLAACRDADKALW